MKKEYDTFVRDFQSLPQGREIQLTIRDLAPGPRKYDAKIVRAIVSANPGKMPQEDTLWLRSSTGVLHTKPWAIQILEEVKDVIHAPPYTDLLGA